MFRSNSMLSMVTVLAVLTSGASGLTPEEAALFTHVYMCTPTGGATAPYISSTYQNGVTVIETNHLPNHEWECVNPNTPGASLATHTFSDVEIQSDSNVYCLPMGPIGIMKNGVYIFNPITAYGGNAYTDEVMDCNGGHSDIPNRYHYHSLPDNGIVYDSSDPSSQFIGVAFDGIPIYSQGEGISENDLDICRGLYVNGEYRYIASVDVYPYYLGCFRGKPQDSSVHASQKCSGMSIGDVCCCQHGIIKFDKKRLLIQLFERLLEKQSGKRSPCGTTYCGDGSAITCRGQSPPP